MQRTTPQPPKVVLIRSAIAAAQAWAALIALTPTIMPEPTLCNAVLREALELLPLDDQQLQKVAPRSASLHVLAARCTMHILKLMLLSKYHG